MPVGGDGIDIIGLYLVAAILNFAGVLFASGIALRLRSTQGAPLMQTPVFLALFLAPVYVPLVLLKGWIHAVATGNPITYLLEAGRGFLSGNPDQVLLAFACGAGLVAFFLIWAFRGLKRAERAS
jgi:ABC-type multidrug transport system permease subunit